jgi:leader peptidase (prepilin peptidase)/N-methyltransferase
MIAVIYGLFGLVIGSFLNVVILRHGARTVGGRSGCLSCGAPLRWFDLIPVVSWVALRGRCRACGSRISVQYPLVEASTAILFAVVGASNLSIPMQIVSLIIVALLVLITVYDLRHTIIPDEWSYAFAFFAFISALAFALGGGIWGLVALVIAGPISALPLFFLWLISRGRWMGLGDAKLALGIGFLLGQSTGLFAVFFAFVVGAVVSVCFLLPYSYLRSKFGITRLGAGGAGFTMKSEVPFGPFLIASTLLVWLMTIYGIPIPFLNIT